MTEWVKRLQGYVRFGYGALHRSDLSICAVIREYCCGI